MVARAGTPPHAHAFLAFRVLDLASRAATPREYEAAPPVDAKPPHALRGGQHAHEEDELRPTPRARSSTSGRCRAAHTLRGGQQVNEEDELRPREHEAAPPCDAKPPRALRGGQQVHKEVELRPRRRSRVLGGPCPLLQLYSGGCLPRKLSTPRAGHTPGVSARAAQPRCSKLRWVACATLRGLFFYFLSETSQCSNISKKLHGETA